MSVLDAESRSPLVVFATRRGLVLGCGDALDDVDDKVAATLAMIRDRYQDDSYLCHLFSKEARSLELWGLKTW